MVKRLGIGALLAAAAVACATEPRWVRPDGSPGDLARDQDDCMSRTVGRMDTDIATDPLERARSQREFESCMQARGWVRGD